MSHHQSFIPISTDEVIVFEDRHLLVASKPHDLPTQPIDGRDRPSLEERLKEGLRSTLGKSGAIFLHAVHRLDARVGGLILFAKTSKALSRLNQQMRERQIKRRYLAEVQGNIQSEGGALEHYLVHGQHKAWISHARDPQAKWARLTYLVSSRSLRHNDPSTLIEIELETGRYHQIRAQLAAFGHPVVNDRLYGSSGTGSTLMLACIRLECSHPISGALMRFSLASP